MKAVVNLGFTFLVAILIALPSCKKSDSGQKVTLTEVLTGGDLFVHLYQEGSTDKTSDYTGYLFTFNTNGTLGCNARCINLQWHLVIDAIVGYPLENSICGYRCRTCFAVSSK